MSTKPNKRSITPERKDAFRDFILSLPRRCSPTMCGIVPLTNVASSTLASLTTTTSNISSASSLLTTNTNMDISSISKANPEDSLEVNTTNSFTWSIDEYAELYGSDFDNEHELDHFHEYESEHFSSHFTDESDRFFSQTSINPSPVLQHRHNTNISTNSSSRSIIVAEKENFPRSTGSFVRYIDTFETNATLTESTEGLLQDYTSSDESESVPMKTFNSIASSVITPKKNAQRQISFEDSDFVSGTTMDISYATSGSSCQAYTGAFHKVESNDLQAKYNRYLDFSPMSPISKRSPFTAAITPLRSLSAKKNLNRCYPMSSFGMTPINDDFANISPIVPAGQKQSKLYSASKQATVHFEMPPTSTCSYQNSQLLLCVASPMSMSIDDISSISACKMPPSNVPSVGIVHQHVPSAFSTNVVETKDKNVDGGFIEEQQHWDTAMSGPALQTQPNGLSGCNETVFKTPHSKPMTMTTRKRGGGGANLRTKLIFNECTSTPN